MRLSLLSKYNQYDYYLILIITSLAAGHWGGAFLPFRIITFFLLPKLFSTLIIYGEYVKKYIYFTIFFFIYIFFSLLWIPSNNEASAHLAYCIFHFILFFEILLFSLRAREPFVSISTGWLIAVALTLIVAMWEITTDNHLSLSKLEGNQVKNLGYTLFVRKFASVTFYNYNSYVTFLCFAMPFLFYKLLNKDNGFVYLWAAIICIILSDVCILFNASRGGLIAMLMMAIMYFISIRKYTNSYIYVFFISIISLFIISYFGESLFTMIEIRMANATLLEGGSRFEIWRHAFNAFAKTLGLGAGIGGIKAAIAAEWYGISVPHNLFLEVLVEFGFIIFICFVVYLYKIIYYAKKYAGHDEKITIYLALFALPIYGIIDSGYLHSPFVFAAFASWIVFASFNQIESQERL